MSIQARPTLDPKTAFGRAAKAMRIEQGRSQEALADFGEMSQPQLSNVETGQADQRLTSVFKLADALGVSVNQPIQRVEQIL